MSMFRYKSKNRTDDIVQRAIASLPAQFRQSLVMPEPREQAPIKAGLKNPEPKKPASKKAPEPELCHIQGGGPAMEELFRMIGLGSVKMQIADIAALIKVRKQRERARLPVLSMSQHLVFTGNPGTGKTTVARLVGEIYRELGFLKKGQFIEIGGRDLVAEYIGQTSSKAQAIINTALDGVLFIDEAYALVPKDPVRDFGPEAIATLLKMMEDYRDRLVVIVAGYEDEMETFLNSNQGLKSRFKTKIDFPDYEAQELVRIFAQLCNDNAYRITEDAIERTLILFTEMDENKGEQFGNGRAVRNAFDRCVMNQARRLSKKRKPSKKELQQIHATDIPNFKDIEW